MIHAKSDWHMRRCLELTVALTVLLLAGCTTTAPSEATSTSPPISTPLRHKAPPPVVLSAAKCETGLPKNLVVKDRFTRSLSVDGGKLLVTPLPPNAFPTVGLSRARRVVAAAQSGEGRPRHRQHLEAGPSRPVAL